MSYIDMVYLGLLLVAFLGFGAALGYCYRRQRRNPPTRLESKRFRRGEIPKAPMCCFGNPRRRRRVVLWEANRQIGRLQCPCS